MYYGSIGMLGGFGMLLFWAGFIWLIVWLIQQNSRGTSRKDGALEIAKNRYAKGEITKKEFEEIKRAL